MNYALRIYDGSTDYNGDNPSTNLLHELQGDLLWFDFWDESNYQFDSIEARIANTDGRYTGEIEIDDVWRLFDLAGNLLGSGPITKQPQADNNGNLVLTGEGWTGILTRRVLEAEEWNNEDGDKIIGDILDDYFSDYTIDKTEIVDMNPAFTNIRSIEGIHAWHFIKQILEASEDGTGGTNNQQCDMYIYEKTASPGELYAKVFGREKAAIVDTITAGDIMRNGYMLKKRADLNFNYIKIYGKRLYEVNPQPNDKDWWTNTSTYNNFWSVTGGSLLRDTTGEKVGTAYIKAQSDADNNSMTLYCDISDADAYDASYFDSNIYSSSGYKLSQAKEQYIGFWITYHDDDAGGGEKTIYFYTTVAGSDYVGDIRPILMPDEDVWLWLEYKLKDMFGFEDNALMTLLFWTGEANSWDNNDELGIDGLYFFEKHQAQGDSSGVAGSPGTPRRDYTKYLDFLDSDADCTKFAEELYDRFNRDVYEGQLYLNDQNFHSVRAGDSIGIEYHEDSIAKIGVQRAHINPKDTVYHVGRHRTQAEIINDLTYKLGVRSR